MLVGSIPWLSYDFWLSRSHPILSVWNAQNRTPSPPIHEFLIGYGLVFLLALAAILIAQTYRTSKGRFLIAWTMTQGVFLYAPIALQRRFALGLFFPLAGLAALGVQRLFRGQQTFRVAMILLLLLSIPSNLLVMISGIYGALQGDSAIMLQKEENAAYQWLSDHSASGDLILAGPRTGNRIPAFGPQRVLYGHPFETPSAEQMRELVESFYREAEGVVDSLADLGVVYVMYGPEEQALGKAPWLRELNLVFVRGEYQIFELMNP
jgi:hypothetical protein